MSVTEPIRLDAMRRVKRRDGSHTIGTAGTNFDQISLTGTGTTFTVGGAILQILPETGVVLNTNYPIVTTSSPKRGLRVN